MLMTQQGGGVALYQIGTSGTHVTIPYGILRGGHWDAILLPIFLSFSRLLKNKAAIVASRFRSTALLLPALPLSGFQRCDSETIVRACFIYSQQERLLSPSPTAKVTGIIRSVPACCRFGPAARASLTNCVQVRDGRRLRAPHTGGGMDSVVL